ncbi:MAG: phosphodiesterase [Firmicutes bacterium]|nr:phosphodiesterase [Bacillota bacterium]
MKYLVASDLHGSIHYVDILIKRFLDEKADKLILLGDLYYHGPRNALPLDYNTMECANLLNQYKDNIIAVRGNCDAEVDQMISLFKFIPQYESMIAGKKFFFSHGHIYNKDNPPDVDFDILMYGHLHTGYIVLHSYHSELGKEFQKIFVNTGSVSLPKNNTPHSYVVIDSNIILLKELESKKEIQRIQF